jgi:hypothetical protein
MNIQTIENTAYIDDNRRGISRREKQNFRQLVISVGVGSSHPDPSWNIARLYKSSSHCSKSGELFISLRKTIVVASRPHAIDDEPQMTTGLCASTASWYVQIRYTHSLSRVLSISSNDGPYLLRSRLQNDQSRDGLAVHISVRLLGHKAASSMN